MVYLVVTGRVPSYRMCTASFPFFLLFHGFVLKSLPSFPSPLQYIQTITTELIFSQHNFSIKSIPAPPNGVFILTGCLMRLQTQSRSGEC